ncbi:MAG: ThiF family adenylyltransferase [Lacipirellulaceae bacterium]
MADAVNPADSEQPIDPFARYAKQVRYAPIGIEGQRRLAASGVLVVGCGALGSTVAESLVRAGVGRVRIVDRDYVELSNLQRQSLFTEADAAEGTPKAVAAERRLRAVNSSVVAQGIVADFTHRNARELADGCDLFVDGTDNFEARLLLNDLALATGTPWVYGGVIGAEGRVMPIVPGKTACLACLVPDAPAPGETPTCDALGVLGPAVGVVASLEALEAIKLLVGAGESVAHGLTVIDLWANRWRSLSIKPTPGCRACGERDFAWLDGRRAHSSVTLCGRGAVQLSPPEGAPAVDLRATRERLATLGVVRGNEFLVRVDAPPHGLTLFADGRVIVTGVEDESQARGVVARLLGC